MEGHLTRRSFVAGTVAVGAVAIAPIALAQPAAALATVAAGAGTTLRRSTFAPLLGGTFRMATGRSSVPVVLSQIDDLKPASLPGDENRFSLLFTTPGHPQFPQGTYSLVHPSLSVALFVVPLGRAATAQRYLAIINRR